MHSILKQRKLYRKKLSSSPRSLSSSRSQASLGSQQSLLSQSSQSSVPSQKSFRSSLSYKTHYSFFSRHSHQSGRTPSQHSLLGMEEDQVEEVEGEEETEQVIKPEEPEEPTLCEKIKFYTTLLLGTLAIVDVFAFLFLIPFILDPTISTLLAKFSESQGTCITRTTETYFGINNCTWSSCREGCTVPLLKCTLIRVNYNTDPYPYKENLIKDYEGQMPIDSDWDIVDAQLFINIKGCVYPPYVRCQDFNELYATVGRIYPCYYSQVDTNLVVTTYNKESNLQLLLCAALLPPVIFCVCVGVLCIWYCKCCQERCPQMYAVKAPSEHSHQSLKEEDDDDDEEDEQEVGIIKNEADKECPEDIPKS